MNFQGEDIKLSEVYNAVFEDTVEELEEELKKQRVGFSRIDFKELRDEAVSKVETYADLSHIGFGSDSIGGMLYNINRNEKDGFVDPEFGKIIDYDVVVSDTLKIDVLTETSDKLYLVKATENKSSELLYRVVLEAITVYNMLSRKQLLLNYRNTSVNRIQASHTKKDLVPGVLLYDNSMPFNELRELEPNSYLGRLIQKYGVRFFIVEAGEANEFKLSEK